jgi:hypothetical protein
MLDEALFPAVAGTPPRASRRDRLDRWAKVLDSHGCTPEAVYAGLAACDSAIANGWDGPKVMAAIQSWFAAKGAEKGTIKINREKELQ